MSHQCLSPVRLLSKDSPSGGMKAVVRHCIIKGEDKQFLEVCDCQSCSDSSLSVFPALLKDTVLVILYIFAPC